MSAIQFTTIVGPDGAIRPPAGVVLPEGEIEVEVRRRPFQLGQAEDALRHACARRGFKWDAMTEEERENFIDDLVHEDRPCNP